MPQIKSGDHRVKHYRSSKTGLEFWPDYREADFRGHSPHFNPGELHCKGAESLLVHWPSLRALNELRARLGRPVRVTSAYRSPEWNKKVGGSKNSYHLQGRAFDLLYNGGDDLCELYEVARNIGFCGFGFYRSFIHIDTRRAVDRGLMVYGRRDYDKISAWVG